ncbi:MAG: acetyl-CoA carboxylase carboxyltransferase subunit alpha [Kiritimatiellae bacterium]|nr:acetyl-CoA carboxylase carboxyltransferase subunit alpha [Kiritimatiellia bacterium]
MDLDFEAPLLDIENRIAELEELGSGSEIKFRSEITELRRKAKSISKKIYKNLTPWQTVQVARHKDRPLINDYIKNICSNFIELHGDRCYGDDQGIIGGFATIGNRQVMLIGHQKGKSVEENLECNFGMANPEGYRKALRLMRLAERYKLPVVSLIDTPGAYPGLEAEERGQAEAIARNLAEMSQLETPIVIVITGEGGSGGAIGIGVGDSIIMLENAVYSVISPEGCASILWRDGSKAPLAAEALKVTSDELLKLKVIDEIIPEPAGGAHRASDETMIAVKQTIVKHIDRLKRVAPTKLINKRYEKFAALGRFGKKKR